MLNHVPQNRLDRAFYSYQEDYEKKALEVLRTGRYILGPEVSAFENEFAQYVGSEYCVGVASGLDALTLGIRALGIGEGDEVIVQGNAYIASVMGITINSATPVFVEPDEFHSIDANAIESAITSKTKAVMVVHLYGQPADMQRISMICKDNGLFLIEDCAQSHGALFNGKMTGSFGDIGCFSYYPSKNLGAFGDAGAVVTNDAEIAHKVRVLRNYGSEKRYHNECVGANSRLDELQAGLLRIRLSHMDAINSERRSLAERYLANISNREVVLPKVRANTLPVWHQFVIRCEHRDALQQHLKDAGVGTIIHYPIPPHLSKAYGYLGFKQGAFPITERLANEVLSLPMFTGMTIEEQDYVVEAINSFRSGGIK